MFQLARQNQRRIETSHVARTVDHVPAAGKQGLTDQELGAPDYYQVAIHSALRELDALRGTALPNLAATRRKKDLAPLTKQIELAKAAMQVRHMILSANAHVYALESAATYTDPMVTFLRERLARVVVRATKLGAYDGALDMRPRQYVDDTVKRGGATHKVKLATTPPPPIHDGSFAPTKPAEIRRASPKSGNTPARVTLRSRTARAVATVKVAPSSGAPTDQRASAANLRPGFRPGVGA